MKNRLYFRRKTRVKNERAKAYHLRGWHLAVDAETPANAFKVKTLPTWPLGEICSCCFLREKAKIETH